jgi:hypothetical protein
MRPNDTPPPTIMTAIHIGLTAKCAARLKNARNVAKMPTDITVVEVRGVVLVLLGD